MVIYYSGSRKLIQMERQGEKQIKSKTANQVEKAAVGWIVTALRTSGWVRGLGPFPCCDVRSWLNPGCYPAPFLVSLLISETNVYLFFPSWLPETLPQPSWRNTWPYIPSKAVARCPTKSFQNHLEGWCWCSLLPVPTLVVWIVSTWNSSLVINR